MRLAWMLIASPFALLLPGCGSDASTTCYSINGYSCYTGQDGGAEFDSPPSATPMLVRVDPGKMLTAGPGEGVGVFVEYASGGHWTIWWTCDTNKVPSDSCVYDINATVPSGAAITDVAGYDGTTLSPPDGGSSTGPVFPLQGMTTNEIQGVTFNTAPGAIIEVSASLAQQYSGSLFYFIDADKVKDGYLGALTDPLEFQPTSP